VCSDVAEGLLLDMEFCADLMTNGHAVRPLQCLRAWDYHRDDILELKYEDMVHNPYGFMLDVFRFLGVLSDDELGMKTLMSHLKNIVRARMLPSGRPRSMPMLPSWNVLSAVYDNRFEKKAKGRARGSEDQGSHYRKGVGGDWVNYFNPVHKERFLELYGDVLIRTGYEGDNNW